MPDPLLLVIKELGAERSVHIRDKARLGRGADADVVLGDGGVSRIHAQLTPAPEGWLLEDSGSRNGTLLNGDRLAAGQRVSVHAGDALQLGGATVVVAASPDVAPRPITAAPPAGGAPLQPAFAWTPPGGTALASPPASSPTATWILDTASLQRSAGAHPAPSALATGEGQRPVESTVPIAPPPPVPGTAAVIPGLVRVGRAIDNDLAIADPRVASYHLDARWTGTGLLVRDLSGGQTSVDGHPLTSAPVHPDATLFLGGSFALPARALLERLAAVGAVASAPVQRAVPQLEHLLVAQGVRRRVGEKEILRGIDFAVRRGQFVAVAGASGAGKSTLMNVLNGYVAPDAGSVDVVRAADDEPDLGYVPQDDIIHRTLTLRDAVVLSAMLRFPPGTPEAQVDARCDEVLTELGLREHAATRVERLSGGQRKRASVALELMTRPRLLLLDEPTSGLDPASDRRLIALLGALADSGYGIVLITHTTTNIDACDTVAFLATGGYLIFWGSPHEAREYFGCTNLEEVYERLEDAQYGTPEEWRRRFEASPHYANLSREVEAGHREFEEQRRIAMPHLQGPGAMQMPPPPGIPQYGSAPASAITPRKPGIVSWQIKGLSKRYFKTLLADRRTLLIMLIQAPFIVVLARLLFPGDSLSANPNNPTTDPNFAFDQRGTVQALSDHAGKGVQLLFLLGTTLVWLGTINAAREICKETPIWQRERHAGVRPGPYLLSKYLVLGAVCLVQTVLWLGLILVLFSLPDSGGPPGFFVVGFATALSGVAVGLVISAAMPTPDRAVTVVPLVMIPQLLFSGAIISLSEMGGVGGAASALFSGRWTFEGLGRLIDPTNRLIDPFNRSFDPATGAANDTVTQRGFDGSAAVPLLGLLLLTLAFGAIAAWLITNKGVPRGARRRVPRPAAMAGGWPQAAPPYPPPPYMAPAPYPGGPPQYPQQYAPPPPPPQWAQQPPPGQPPGPYGQPPPPPR